jgi:hypothetical protein
MFAVAAFADKLLLQSYRLPVEQVVSLVDQTDQSIGGGGGVRLFDEATVGVGVICSIGPIRRIGLKTKPFRRMGYAQRYPPIRQVATTGPRR